MEKQKKCAKENEKVWKKKLRKWAKENEKEWKKTEKVC